MKKILLFSTLLAGILYISPARAQVSIHVNIGAQPSWGPVGYNYVDYYYLPDIEAYYNVPNRVFIYFDAGRWISSPILPPRCCNYDLYSGYKVVVNEPRPWMHFAYHSRRYADYCHRGGQVFIRDSHDPRYYRDGDDRWRDDRGRNDYGRREDYRRDDHDDDDDHDNGRHRGHDRRDDR